MRDIIDELRADQVTVFLNSHLLGEVEATCDRVAFVKRGRIVAERRLSGPKRRSIWNCVWLGPPTCPA